MNKRAGKFYFKGTNNLGILLCHGFTGSPDEMKELGRFLNKLGYTVSCPQYSGHGTDEANFLETDIYVWYSELESAYEELQKDVDGIYVMGLSMGGSFTVKLAEEREILGLVTMNAPIIGLPLKEEFDFIVNTKYDAEKFQKQLTKFSRLVVEIGQIVNLEKVKAPLLVIQGAKDRDEFKISSSMLMEYTSSLYKSRLDFEKSGHVIVIEEERYDLFDVIRDFLIEIGKMF